MACARGGLATARLLQIGRDFYSNSLEITPLLVVASDCLIYGQRERRELHNVCREVMFCW
jgi:hypothetical protein